MTKSNAGIIDNIEKQFIVNFMNDRKLDFIKKEDSVLYLQNKDNGAELFIVGTNHLSSKSAQLVKFVIMNVQPDYVMLELDQKRFDNFTNEDNDDYLNHLVENWDLDAPLNTFLGHINNNEFFYCYLRLLKIHKGLIYGHEFKVAIEEAKKVKANIILGDSKYKTYQRNLQAHISKLGDIHENKDGLVVESKSSENIFQAFARVENCKQLHLDNTCTVRNLMDRDARSARVKSRSAIEKQLMANKTTNPIFHKSLMERNEAMTTSLKTLKGKVVGIVGKAHLSGIEELWHDSNLG